MQSEEGGASVLEPLAGTPVDRIACLSRGIGGLGEPVAYPSPPHCGVRSQVVVYSLPPCSLSFFIDIYIYIISFFETNKTNVTIFLIYLHLSTSLYIYIHLKKTNVND